MRVLKYSVKNVMKISDATIDMDGHNLILVGGANGSGKTSALTGLLLALCGKSGMDWPDIPLKEGTSKGWVKVNLSGDPELHDSVGFTVELLLRKRRGGSVVEEFRVLDSTGEEAGSPRDLLKSLYAFRAFDPLAFEAAKPKERGEIIRRLVGLDFTGLEQDRKKLFEQRTLVNRDLKAAEARRAAITYPPTTPDERMSIGKLSIDKDMAQENNRNIKENVTKLESLKSQHTKLSEEVKKLEDRLVQIASTMVSLNTSIAEQEDTVRKGVTIDVSAIQAQIEQADTINMAVEKKQTAKKLDAEIQRFSVESEKASVRIEGIDNNKLKMLAEAKWPLPGMSVDEDGVMLDGLPFEQASKAQRVLASVKVGMALNPKLRLLVCQDGNDLDNDTMAVLEQELKANDFQLLLEVVTKSKEDEDRCSVVFVDGVQSGTEPEESDDSEDEELVDTETELADLDA